MYNIVLFSSKNELAKKVSNRMPALNKSAKAFGKQNSQTTASLMTLNMIDSGPYRVLRQILAQIQRKYEALKEAAYRHEENLIRIKEIDKELEEVHKSGPRARLELEKRKILSDVEDSKIYIDAAIKELGAYQDRYYEVMSGNDIPEDWTEKDFEDAEVKHHITQIFKNAIRDRMAGNHNHGTMEYMEQLGIEPIMAYGLVDKFIASLKENTSATQGPDISVRYRFYDDMAKVFRDEYKKALNRIGLKTATYDEWMLTHD